MDSAILDKMLCDQFLWTVLQRFNISIFLRIRDTLSSIIILSGVIYTLNPMSGASQQPISVWQEATTNCLYRDILPLELLNQPCELQWQRCLYGDDRSASGMWQRQASGVQQQAIAVKLVTK